MYAQRSFHWISSSVIPRRAQRGLVLPSGPFEKPTRTIDCKPGGGFSSDARTTTQRLHLRDNGERMWYHREMWGWSRVSLNPKQRRTIPLVSGNATGHVQGQTRLSPQIGVGRSARFGIF